MHIGAEDEVAELGERQEDDAEHDGEGDEVLGGVVDGCRHVAHRVGEVEVFEQLQQRTMTQHQFNLATKLRSTALLLIVNIEHSILRNNGYQTRPLKPGMDRTPGCVSKYGQYVSVSARLVRAGLEVRGGV